ncbi:hypothetical protein P7K49_005627 [Saguinus oedipus]|uniref:Uncharacterized protein n=1 Tax=Saguinus oedipus TaxID=9490 RepID=A0ABQ9W042_SAGOE|nr:hypothetical protein P7K49_005627 [Saguinus oedipus]
MCPPRHAKSGDSLPNSNSRLMEKHHGRASLGHGERARKRPKMECAPPVPKHLRVNTACWAQSGEEQQSAKPPQCSGQAAHAEAWAQLHTVAGFAALDAGLKASADDKSKSSSFSKEEQNTALETHFNR